MPAGGHVVDAMNTPSISPLAMWALCDGKANCPEFRLMWQWGKSGSPPKPWSARFSDGCWADAADVMLSINAALRLTMAMSLRIAPPPPLELAFETQLTEDRAAFWLT